MAIQRVVGGGQQVHRGVTGQEGDVRVGAHRLDQGDLDGLAGVIRHVQDARDRMAALARQRKLAVFGEIKLDRGTLEQDYVDALWALHGQDVHRDRVAVVVAGANDVLSQERRRVVHAPVDDTALRVERIRLLRVVRAGHDDDLHALVGQLQRRRRAGNPAAQDQDFGFDVFGQGCVSRGGRLVHW